MSVSARHSGSCCPVLELRRYEMQPGGFDELHALFEKTFVRELEAAGMHLVGFFHLAKDPSRFVWMRGFDGLAERHAAYSAFYDGPVWKALRPAAVAKMVDSSDVLLLRPIDGRGFQRSAAPTGAAREPTTARIIATLLFLNSSPTLAVRQAFLAAHDAARVERLGAFESEDGKNTWTRHPVRTGEQVLAAFSWVDSPGVDAAVAALDLSLTGLRAQTLRAPEHLVLEPTWLSRLR